MVQIVFIGEGFSSMEKISKLIMENDNNLDKAREGLKEHKAKIEKIEFDGNKKIVYVSKESNLLLG